MAGFFKQLIDLGEERPEQSTPPASDDIAQLDNAQLVTMVNHLQQELTTKKEEFDRLRDESSKLRSEYDAYKHKIESWQIKMKEDRDSDRRLIEQLRAAGSNGSADDLMIKSMNDTIGKYKEEIRAAKDEAAKEYRRRQETEEARARFEETKKSETEALIAKFERNMEQIRKAQNAAELKARNSESRNEKLSAELKEAVAKRATAEARERELLDRVAALEASGAVAVAGGGASSASADGSSGSASTDGVVEALRQQVAALQSSLAEARTLAEVKRQEYETTLAEQGAVAAELRSEVDRLAAAAQEAQTELLSGEKRYADARAAADAQATRQTAALADAEKTLATVQLERAELARQLRVASDELASMREARIAEDKEHAATIADVQAELATLRGAVRAREDAVGAAEESQLRAAEAVAAERRQMEAQIAALERRLQEGDTQRQGLEETIADLKAELRRRLVTFDDLRRELEEQTQRTAEAEAQLAANHMTVTTRDDEVVAREREKQTLKHQLHLERENADRLRKQLAEYDERVEDERSRMNATLARVKDLESDRTRLLAELRLESQKVSDFAVSNEAAQRMIRELQLQLTEQGSRTADAVKIREDQSAKVRQLESRLRETESRLQSALDREAVTSSGAGPLSAAPRAPTHPSAVLSSAFSQGGRATWTQSRTAIAVGVFLLIALGFFNSIGNVPTQRASVGDPDSVITLKEKYAQALESAFSCREASKRLCPCQPPTAGAGVLVKN